MSCSTWSAMVGAIWNPEAPAPTSANRFPVRSSPSGHRAEWNDGPANVVHAGDVGQPRDVQRTDRADDEPRLEDLRGAVRVADADLPGARRLVPRERRHRGAEAAVRTELVLVEHADEVVAQLGLLAEVLGPVVRRLERVAVVMTADVDARTRVRGSPTRCRPGPRPSRRSRRAGRPATGGSRRGCPTGRSRSRRRATPPSPRPTPRRPTRSRRWSAPSNCMSSRNIGTMIPSSGVPARNAIISTTTSSRQLVGDAPAVAVGGDGRHRASPDGGTLLVVEAALQVERRSACCGATRSRIHDGSPVMCTSEHSSTGTRHVLERGGDGGVVVGERCTDVRVPWVVHGDASGQRRVS